jgi:hypothetical protein
VKQHRSLARSLARSRALSLSLLLFTTHFPPSLHLSLCPRLSLFLCIYITIYICHVTIYTSYRLSMLLSLLLSPDCALHTYYRTDTEHHLNSFESHSICSSTIFQHTLTRTNSAESPRLVLFCPLCQTDGNTFFPPLFSFSL